MSNLVIIIDFIHNDFEHPDITDNIIFTSLAEFDDLYHNGGQSPISDGEYDALRMYAKTVSPSNVYFTGVGSDVRGGKVDLPYEMGSLDQVEIGDIREWVTKNNLQKQRHVASDKMDGTSTMLIYGTGGKSQIAYSRGNGIQGADISRHIFKIKGVPKQVSDKMDVRAEVELTETGFIALRDAGVRRRGGDEYKNARNMVSGLMNSKTIPKVCYEHLTVVCYEVLGHDGDKLQQLELLEEEGFQVVDYTLLNGNQLTDKFLAEFLTQRKADLDYAIDGVVIEVDDAGIRSKMNPTRETLNPKYSIKYKVADADNLAVATVTKVEWNISKHGYLIPRVHVQPTELVGVTVRHATGFNAKFIVDNQVGPGATVNLTRSGDVIPYIMSVASPATAGHSYPQVDGDLEWTVNDDGEQVHLKLVNVHEDDEATIQQTLDFFMSIDAPNLKEGTVRSMFEEYDYANSTDAILDMINYDQSDWVNVIGANGVKIFNGLRTKFDGMPLHVLMGSVPFFGRGVGKRKFKKLEIAFGTKRLHECDFSAANIIGVKGFELKTAIKVIAGVDDYFKFYKRLPDYVNIATMEEVAVGSVIEGKKICMTGFRDKDLAAKVESLGATNQSAVSGATDILVIKDPTSTSGKAKKARDLGVQLMGIDEFKTYIGA